MTDGFDYDLIGIQSQQGPRDLLSASDLVADIQHNAFANG